jgi:N-acetylglucosaminyl-diphospho-decaprenol L-rhamnosyltransferase
VCAVTTHRTTTPRATASTVYERLGTHGREGVDVSAVIVHYRGGEHLRRCVRACLAIHRICEVIVVDNEGVSQDLEADYAGERVLVLDAGGNLGFGRGANLGLARARGASALVLNQDVELSEAALDRMLVTAERSGAWIVGPRLHNIDGRERGRKTAFPTPLRWAPPGPSPGEWHYAPYVIGAVMLLTPDHRDLRFDERFFMYGEDAELCWRVWSEGGSVAYVDDAPVLHVGGTASATRWSDRQTEYRVLLGRARFLRKHAGWRGVGRWTVSVSGAVIRAKLTRG